MAALLLLFFLFSVNGAQARTNQSYVKPGSTLNPMSDSFWLSPSGVFAFGFYNESNGFAVGIFLAGIPEKTVVWIANWEPKKDTQQDRIVSSNATLVLTTEGGISLQEEEKEIYSISSYYGETIASASMRDDGNFVLYNSDGNISWQSFHHPTDTLLPGQNLSERQELFSRASKMDYSKGSFRLKMQRDGNLVQYPINSADTGEYAYYSTNTFGSGVTLTLEDDGHLYLFKSTEIIKNITEKGAYPRQRRLLYTMRLDVDGIFRVYSISLDNGNSTAVWNSTDDKCQPKGRCGLNGICVPTDLDISCHCLPGFHFIDEGNQNSVCVRNLTTVGCNEINKTVDYEMIRSENTTFMDPPYLPFDAINVDDCEKKCLEDCNCEVVLFDRYQRCRMQMLPLRFGRGDEYGYNSIASIKVGVKTIIGNEIRENFKKETVKDRRHTNVLIVCITLVILAVIVLATARVFLNRNHRGSYKKFIPMDNLEIISDVTLQAFSYEQLVQITNNFSEEVGKGASGIVYKGILPNCPTVLAVKKIETELAEGEREFETEMKVIAKTYHRNLVSLLGYCIEGSNRLLVYEFMGNGSLADVLFAPKDHLSWPERVRIALDIVKGILYLHEECKTQIIHCDIKPQNILMDENMCAKISDFGLAKLLVQDQSRTHTGLRGTKGYVAPEWFGKSPVTVKADVYSFGIMLLEIICHRRNVDLNLPENEVSLEEWVYSCFMAGELSHLVVDEEIDMKKLERWVKVGIWCIQEEPSLRPSMKEVLLMLEGTVDVPMPPSPPSFISSL